MPTENFLMKVMYRRTLIEVNDEFVLACAKLIEEVSDVIRKERPGYFF